MEQISRRSMLTVIGGLTGSAALAGCGDDEKSRLSDETSPTIDVDASGSSSEAPTAEPPASTTKPTLVEVSLDAPEALRGRWAAYAATYVATGLALDEPDTYAKGGDWWYVSEIGEWCILVRFKNGRAVLIGQGDPNTRRTAAQEKKARAALIAGGPKWWDVFDKVIKPFDTVGFVLGWDGKKWQQSSGQGSGGYSEFTFALVADEATQEQILIWANKGETNATGLAQQAATRVVSAGPKVTAGQLKALGSGVTDKNVPAALKVAKAFAAPAQR